MKHIFPITILFILGYVSSCANQGSPTGGPKDTIPPTFISSIPANKALNYTSKEFQFEFDERVNADQLRTRLIITPHIENKFKVLVKKNILSISFEENFEDSTTYTFNFADGVGDITEKNPVENFTYAFATGPIIDSIYVTGQVKDLYNNEALKKTLVALYSIHDTLDLFTGKPRYFTQTDENGNFIIENIKAAYYKIYAYDDKDKNLENDPQKEMHGFIADSLNLFTSKDSLELKIQLIDASVPKFVRSKNTGIYYDILYNKYMHHYKLTKIDSTSSLTIPSNNFFKENTIIRFYPDGSIPIEKDSLQLQIECIDSLGNSTIDSVFVQFKSSKRKPESFESKLFPNAKFKVKNTIDFQLTFTKPIIKHNYDSLIITYDTLKNILVHDSIVSWNQNKTTASFKLDIEPSYLLEQIKLVQDEQQRLDSLLRIELESGDSSRLEQPTTHLKIPKNQILVKILKGAFISIDQDTTELIERVYKFLDTDNTGEISGVVTTQETNYILQLVTNKFKVIDQIQSPKEFRFKQVLPGNYGFRILIDKNKDEKWSPGNILKNIEPEPIYFHPEFTDLKAGWSVENLQISF